LTERPKGASRIERMRTALEAAFSPVSLEILDESDRHAGHAGAVGGETHFRVRMVSAAFTELSRVARQRAVMDALQSEFATGLHALALELKPP
jgi:BolA protein